MTTQNINEIIAERICARHGIERNNESETWLEALAWQDIETGQLIDDVLYARELLNKKPAYELWKISGKEPEFDSSFDTLADSFRYVSPGYVVVKDGYKIVSFHEDDFEQIHQWAAVAPWA